MSDEIKLKYFPDTIEASTNALIDHITYWDTYPDSDRPSIRDSFVCRTQWLTKEEFAKKFGGKS